MRRRRRRRTARGGRGGALLLPCGSRRTSRRRTCASKGGGRVLPGRDSQKQRGFPRLTPTHRCQLGHGRARGEPAVERNTGSRRRQLAAMGVHARPTNPCAAGPPPLARLSNTLFASARSGRAYSNSSSSSSSSTSSSSSSSSAAAAAGPQQQQQRQRQQQQPQQQQPAIRAGHQPAAARTRGWRRCSGSAWRRCSWGSWPSRPPRCSRMS